MTNPQNRRKGWVKVTLAEKKKKLLRDTVISAQQHLCLSNCKPSFQIQTKPRLSSSKLFASLSY